jgi:hypothetical protein
MDDEQFNEWLAKFKQFLIDNNAEMYWQYIDEDKLRSSISHPACWVTYAFVWSQTSEGYNYWDHIHNLWDEISNHPLSN